MRDYARLSGRVSPLVRVLVGLSLALALTVSSPAIAGPSASVSCGDTITTDTTLTADLIDCAGNGLVMGADNITLDCDGHTIGGSGSGNGVELSGLPGHSWDTIKNCVVTGFGTGIYLADSSNNTLMGNTVTSNYGAGIYISSSGNNNALTGNTVSSNWSGISLSSSSGTTISGNTITDNTADGLALVSVASSSIYNNTIRNNGGTGVKVSGSGNTLNSNVACSNGLDVSNFGSNSGDDNTCTSTDNWNDTGSTGCTSSCALEPVCYCSSCGECNDRLRADCPVVNLTADIADQGGSCINEGTLFNGEVFDCQGHTIDGTGGGSGILMDGINGHSWDTIKNCVVTGFGTGMQLADSPNNTLTGNRVMSNGTGIYLWSTSDNNLIYNNYFSNAGNANDSRFNTWSITPTPGTNIMGGPYLGGNYWSDYGGGDINGDGLGDTSLPYNANGSIQNGGDYAPLVPAAVGGIADLPDIPESRDSAALHYVALAGLSALAVAALAAGASYARRRRLR